MAMRWRKDKPLTGLMAVVAGPRGSGLYDGETQYAQVYAVSRYNPGAGWYYVCGWDSDIPRINTCNDPCPDEATAKKEAMAYVRENLKAAIMSTPNKGESK